MRTGNVKFGLLALLCLLAVVPIIGNVQKEAAMGPRPAMDHEALRRARHAYQRRELGQWLLSHGGAERVSHSPMSPRVILVTLAPGLSQAQMLDYARQVRRVMVVYFQEGSRGAVTTVDVRSSQSEILIQTGLHDSVAGPDFQWHIVEQGKTIE